MTVCVDGFSDYRSVCGDSMHSDEEHKGIKPCHILPVDEFTTNADLERKPARAKKIFVLKNEKNSGKVQI